MEMRAIRVSTCCLLGVMASAAWGAPYNRWAGRTIRWNITRDNPVLYYQVHANAAIDGEMIRQAFTDWQAVPRAYVVLQEAAPGQPPNIVVKLEQGPNPFSTGYSAETYAADRTTLTYCEVLDAWNADPAIRKSTYLHEIGHCLGLDHSVVRGAIMSYRPGPTLTTDDEYALTLLYPEDESAEYPQGCGTVRDEGGRSRGGGGSGVVGFLVFALMLGAAWRFARGFAMSSRAHVVTDRSILA